MQRLSVPGGTRIWMLDGSKEFFFMARMVRVDQGLREVMGSPWRFSKPNWAELLTAWSEFTVCLILSRGLD